MLKHLPIILDLLTSGWVVVVFIVLFGLLPLVAFPQISLPSLSSRIVGAFVRTMATIAVGSILWAKLGLFTWLTAILVYLLGLGIGWLGSHQWQIDVTFQQLGQQIAISTVDIFDRGVSLSQVCQWLLLPWNSVYLLVKQRFDRQQWSLPLIVLATISAISILSLTMWLRFQHPMLEFRFSHPDTYVQLLTTQQILARDLPPGNYLPVFASLAAFMAALSGVHPIQVIDILGSIFGTLVVLSVGYAIRHLTKNGAAGLAASYSLGAYLFTWELPIWDGFPLAIQQWLSTIKDNLNYGLIRSWAVSDLEVGAIFAILALGCTTHLHKSAQRLEAGINTSCCILLVAAIAPSLLILVLLGGFGIIFGRSMALFSFTIGWLVLAGLTAIPNSDFPILTGVLATLSIGFSLFVGMLFVVITRLGRLLLANWSAPVCLTIFLAITVNFGLPPAPAINYLEYDIAARKSIEISRLLPHHQWTIVAPIEQLSQVYGRGWYQDLAEFVEKYQDRAIDSQFHFPDRTSLFVFAEKIPFGADKPELPVLYSVLVDPTYRNYRSPSGRTKLTQATLKMCETYRQFHPDTQIYYEDEYLRIYQFAPLKISPKL